jgi:hypothetical protein
VPEHGSEADDADSWAAYALIDCLVIAGIRRSERKKRSVGFGCIKPEAHFLQTTRMAVGCAIQRECPEFRLRVVEDVFDRRELQQVPGIARTERKAFSSIYDRAAQAQSHSRDAICEGHRRNWIEIMRSDNSGKIGIEALTMRRADELLNDHCHFFFLKSVWRGTYIGFGVTAESGGVDALDGIDQVRQALSGI